jgi:hemerythrin
MLIWSEEFGTGQETVDKHHQVLFDTVNHLEGLLAQTNYTRQEMEFVLSILDLLESYAQEHFKLEEECMERVKCPVHENNQNAHRQFLVAIQDCQQKCKVHGFRREVLKDLHQFMHDWLKQHIMQIDTQLKPCMVAQ